MDSIPFTQGLAEEILNSDDSPSRFERFCVELFNKVDGVTYVTTSSSWDLGQDGRDISLLPAGENPVLCCSLQKDIPPKVDKDLRRLSETVRPTTVRYCASSSLSEHAVDGISGAVRGLAPCFKTVQVVGAHNIASLLMQNTDYAATFTKHYRSEIDNWKKALNQPGDTHTAQLDGMRLALTTQLTRTGDELRAEITRNLILTSLADGSAKTRSAIASHISRQLHLGRAVHEFYVSHSLDQLLAEDSISRVGDAYRVSSAGLTAIQAYTSQGTKSLGKGRALVKEAIASLSGHTLSDSEFSTAWTIIQDELSTLFYDLGIHVIEAIASISDNGGTFQEFTEVNERIKKLGTKVASALANGTRAKAVGTAVADMLFERHSKAYEWFTDVSSCYIAVCSLGLEPTAQNSLAGRIRDIELILDSDILLSYFCAGEEDHSSIRELIRCWRAAGGRVVVTTSVMEEVAYHAWIAEQDFKEVFHQMNNYSPEDARRLITNAFVRGYWKEVQSRKRKVAHSSWREYLNNFVGTHSYDYAKVMYDLEAEGFEVISDDAADDALAARIANRILVSQYPDTDHPASPKAIDKAKRDGRLLAILARRREKRMPQGHSSTIVSSAAALRRACPESPALTCAPEPVMPLAAIAYLLSYVPGVNASLSTMKTLLFHPVLRDGVPSLQRKALRMIFESGQYSLPYSRRPALQKEMFTRMKEIATQRGQTLSEVQEQMEKGSDPKLRDVLGEIVRESIDSVVESRAEQEKAQLRAKIDELVKENEKLRRKQK